MGIKTFYSAGPVAQSFFAPEFCYPDQNFLPASAKLILIHANESQSYSLCTPQNSRIDVVDQTKSIKNFPDSPSIKFGEKIGILMRGYEEIHRLFFLYQRFPNHPLPQLGDRLALDCLLDYLEYLATSAEEKIIVCPIDLEAPMVESHFDPLTIWGDFLSGVQARGLAEMFVPLSSLYAELEERARYQPNAPDAVCGINLPLMKSICSIY